MWFFFQPRIGCFYEVREDENTNKVTCPVGNPLKREEDLKVDFRLNAEKVSAVDKIIAIELGVNTWVVDVIQRYYSIYDNMQSKEI